MCFVCVYVWESASARDAKTKAKPAMNMYQFMTGPRAHNTPVSLANVPEPHTI